MARIGRRTQAEQRFKVVAVVGDFDVLAQQSHRCGAVGVDANQAINRCSRVEPVDVVGENPVGVGAELQLDAIVAAETPIWAVVFVEAGVVVTPDRKLVRWCWQPNRTNAYRNRCYRRRGPRRRYSNAG